MNNFIFISIFLLLIYNQLVFADKYEARIFGESDCAEVQHSKRGYDMNDCKDAMGTLVGTGEFNSFKFKLHKSIQTGFEFYMEMFDSEGCTGSLTGSQVCQLDMCCLFRITLGDKTFLSWEVNKVGASVAVIALLITIVLIVCAILFGFIYYKFFRTPTGYGLLQEGHANFVKEKDHHKHRKDKHSKKKQELNLVKTSNEAPIIEAQFN